MNYGCMLAELIDIPTSLTKLAQITTFENFNEGLTKINLIHKFFISTVKNEINIILYMCNNSNEIQKYEIDELLDFEKNYIQEIEISNYDDLIELRNYYISIDTFKYFNEYKK